MVAEVFEVDVEPLRQALSEDKEVLRALWKELLPSVILLIQK